MYGPVRLGRRALSCSTKDERGQVLVEMALVAVFMAILLAGLFDLWRAYYTYIAVTDAAAEGATYGAAFPNRPVDDIRTRAASASAGLVVISLDQVEVVTDTETITVSVSYAHHLMTPFMETIAGGPTISITQRAVEPVLE